MPSHIPPTTPPQSARRLATLPHSGIREIAAYAGSRDGLVHLEFGQPSMMTPEPIRRAAAEAVRSQRMTYTPTQGPESLRTLISRKVANVNGSPTAPDEVFVTPGGTSALFLALSALLDPGDRALLPDPGFPNPVGQVFTLGAEPRFYELPADNGYLPDPDTWHIPERCRAVMLNSPANPTGGVTPRDVLERVVELARRHDIWIISDEVYDQIWFDREPVSLRALAPERTISIYSFSKTYAMTGWRLGYLVAPRSLVDAMGPLAESVFASSSMVSQIAAEAALTQANEGIPAMVAEYRQKRDLVLDLAREWGLYRYTPEGAFYLMVDVAAAGSGDEVARRLVDDYGVVTVPGSAFGASATTQLRLSLAATDDDIRAGMIAIRDVVHG